MRKEMKTVRCLNISRWETRDKWVYPWKEFVAVSSFLSSSSEPFYRVYEHHVPFFLSLHAHLAMEHVLERLWNRLFWQFPFKNLLFVYDFLHGVLCSYNMREILEWWNARKDDGTMSEIPC